MSEGDVPDQDSGAGTTDRPEFKLLIDKNADGIIVVDHGGVILFVNPAAQTIFGRRIEELIGSPIGVPIVVGETVEISLLRPGGHRIDAEMRVVETVWNGRTALLASLRDITTRRITEARLNQAQKMEAIGQLTAGIAHDFNNLLTVTTGNLELLQEKLSRRPALRKMLDTAMGALVRAERLTAHLLAFSRKQRLEAKPLDVNQVLIDMDELLHRTVGPAIELRYAMDSRLPLGLIDRSQLETALLNLVLNARDAMANGGSLTVTTGTIELDAHYVATHSDAEPGRYVAIAISDTGHGMTPDILRRVFEPFFSTKEPGKGTGLGLPMVYGFVTQSGGHVRIDSTPGRGTTVTIHLPLAEAGRDGLPIGEESPRPAVERGTETVLVVEDDQAVRAFACATLRDRGYKVVEAANGDAALDILRKRGDIDVVFSDVVMPGEVNGIGLAKEVIRHRSAVKLILTSGYSSHFIDPDGTLDTVEFLRKPYRPTELSARLRKVLDGASRPVASRRK